jgi:uncharacterized phiE125 gp8 family phage protein
VPVATKATTLFSLDVVKAHIKATATTHDAVLARFADAVSERIETFTQRAFVTRARTETIDGSGRASIRFSTYPVISVTTLSYRNTLRDAFVDYLASDFVLDGQTGTVHLVCGEFPRSPLAVKGVLSVGFGAQDSATLPADVVQMGLDYVKFLYDRWKSDAIALGSVNVAAGGSAVFVPDLPKEMKDALAPWVKRRL